MAKMGSKVIVISPDGSYSNIIQKFFREHFGDTRFVFENHSSFDIAWESSMKTMSPALVFLDWHQQSRTGIAVFNRIKGVEHLRTTPVIVFSGQLSDEEFRLLSEYPATRFLKNLMDRGSFFDTVDSVLKEGNWLINNDQLLNQYTQEIESSPEAVIDSVKSIMSRMPNPTPILLALARRLREKGAFAAGATLLNKLLLKDKRNIVAMTELAKINYAQGNLEESRDLLSISSYLSPHSIERLCFHGQVQLDLKNVDGAKKSFKEALGIDKDNSNAKLGLETADIAPQVWTDHRNDQVVANFSSMANMVAIMKVKEEDFGGAVEKYEAALSFVQKPEDMSRVKFNMGMAYVRWNKLEEASEWLIKSAGPGSPVAKKATKYLTAIEEKMADKLDDIVGYDVDDVDMSMMSFEDIEDEITELDEMEEVFTPSMRKSG